jgi:hypothetical protein
MLSLQIKIFSKTDVAVNHPHLSKVDAIIVPHSKNPGAAVKCD